ncbi:MAG: hypothetical protein LBK58_02530 [Prevotellaceae bacterium]|nr:hypothetical protein [Prevotellaceae bacterium]
MNSVFYETEKNLGFKLTVKSETGDLIIKHYWYDKITERIYETVPTTVNISEKGLVYPDLIPQPIGICGNYYIGEIRPEQIEPLMQYQKEKKGTKDTLYFENEELRKIIRLDEDPNQVIVLYKLDFNK